MSCCQNKLKIRKLKWLHVFFDEYWLKQHNLLEHGSYHLDSCLKGTATTAPRLLREKNRLKFLYRQSKNLNPAFWKRPSTTLIQLNWLPINEIYRTCIANTAFIYWNGPAPANINDMFKPLYCVHNTLLTMAVDIPR